MISSIVILLAVIIITLINRKRLKDKLREINIYRSIGYNNNDIKKIIICENLIIGIISLILSLLITIILVAILICIQNYKPYIIYKNVVSKLLEQTHYSEEKQNDIIITIWAFIHGVTSLATMNNVNYDNDWREKVIDFMGVFQLSFLDNTGEKI